MDIRPDALIADFVQVAALAGISISSNDVEYEKLTAPHTRPKKLPPGKKVVYVFCTAEKCLKVGKAGLKSQARFISHHYNPGSANSNLSKSLLADRGSGSTPLFFTAAETLDLSESNVGAWVTANTSRYHFFLHETQPCVLLSLLEIFLQCRLEPVFEG